MRGDVHSMERLEALLADQSALRRVATLVAADPDPRRLFDCVCEELGGVLGVDSTDMLRYEGDGSATVVGTWTASGAPSFPVGTSVPLDGETVTAKLHRSGAPERVDDYAGVGGELAERPRATKLVPRRPTTMRSAPSARAAASSASAGSPSRSTVRTSAPPCRANSSRASARSCAASRTGSSSASGTAPLDRSVSRVVTTVTRPSSPAASAALASARRRRPTRRSRR